MSAGWTALVAVAFAFATGCGRIGFSEVAVNGGDGDATTVTLIPALSTINVGSKVELVADGGVPPYELALVGEGSLTGTTFVAPTRAGESLVSATDSLGRSATATIRYRGERLFVVGGLVGGTAVPTVLSSEDGAIWTSLGALPAARANGALVVYDDRMFYLGGLNAGGAPTNEVFSSSDGVTWTQVGTLPITNTGFTSIVHRGAMWIVGGATGAGDGVDTYHSTDGATWTAAAKIAGPRHEHDLISDGDTLYVLGGHGGALLDDVQSTTDGTAWSPRGAVLTFTADFAAAAQLDDRVVRICGAGCTATESSTDLVTWTPGANLPAMRESPGLVAFGGRLLVIGGGSTAVLATTDGSSWPTVGTLPDARVRTAAVQFTPR